MRKFLSRLSDWILPAALLGLAFMYGIPFGGDSWGLLPWGWMAVYCLFLCTCSIIFVVKKQINDAEKERILENIGKTEVVKVEGEETMSAGTKKHGKKKFIILIIIIACVAPFISKAFKEADSYVANNNEPELSFSNVKELTKKLKIDGNKIVGRKVNVQGTYIRSDRIGEILTIYMRDGISSAFEDGLASFLENLTDLDNDDILLVGVEDKNLTEDMSNKLLSLKGGSSKIKIHGIVEKARKSNFIGIGGDVIATVSVTSIEIVK